MPDRQFSQNYATAMCVVLVSTFVLSDASGQTEQLRQEQLRGSITKEREWWDLQHYHLSVEFDPDQKRISGSNRITFRTLRPGKRLQVDLQPPLEITRVTHGDSELDFVREGNAFWINFPKGMAQGIEDSIVVYYEGKPREAIRPPWDGGVSWDADEQGRPFIVTTCQGIGASIWWPTKDHGYDEPDRGMNISLTVPEALSAVSNGRLSKIDEDKTNKKRTFHWTVSQPINNYCVNANIGHYVHFSEKYNGEGGELDIDYWVLDYQREKAEKQFREAPRTLAAFEHWFGKYPFYADSYKLVEVTYPGMEHQSSVTYGNGYKNGYGGRDLSDTGVGFKFDFIIVHESGHEWFGNNVSMKDVADMWIHEGFTNYSENLFVEFHFDEKQAQDYVIGCRELVKNDKPIIGEYGLNRSGSGDMYYKAGNMLHTMRHILDNDQKWRSLLRGINTDFWHQTVTTQQIESYINEKSGIDYSKFFDQYLRDTRIPVLYYELDGSRLSYWYDNVVEGFSFPVDVVINGVEQRITPATSRRSMDFGEELKSIEMDRNFFYDAIEVETIGQ